MTFIDDVPKLESKYQTQFSTWQNNPDKHNTSKLMKSIQPDIDRGISAHVGQSNPLIRSRARKIALGAVRSYNPTKARLGTHIVNQLQGLKRISRKHQQIMRVPERVSLEASSTERMRKQLEDDLGREPTDVELSDATGLSAKRLKYVRSYREPTAEGYWTSMSEKEDGGYMPTVSDDRSDDAWLQLIYSDMDATNQKIMEWSLGMGGGKILPNATIARKLRLSPGAISQRKAKIQHALNQQDDRSPF